MTLLRRQEKLVTPEGQTPRIQYLLEYLKFVDCRVPANDLSRIQKLKNNPFINSLVRNDGSTTIAAHSARASEAYSIFDNRHFRFRNRGNGTQYSSLGATATLLYGPAMSEEDALYNQMLLAHRHKEGEVQVIIERTTPRPKRTQDEEEALLRNVFLDTAMAEPDFAEPIQGPRGNEPVAYHIGHTCLKGFVNLRTGEIFQNPDFTGQPEPF